MTDLKKSDDTGNKSTKFVINLLSNLTLFVYACKCDMIPLFNHCYTCLYQGGCPVWDLKIGQSHNFPVQWF